MSHISDHIYASFSILFFDPLYTIDPGGEEDKISSSSSFAKKKQCTAGSLLSSSSFGPECGLV
jgi:hypothetical protein